MKHKNKSEQEAQSNQDKEKQANLWYTNIDKYDKVGAFQHIVGMAAHIYNVPLAFVNFVNDKSIQFKSSAGLEGISEIKKELGLCSLAVLRDEITVFENLRTEKGLEIDPVFYSSIGLQFYAAAPIKAPDGSKIGVVAIADKKPRKFSGEDKKMLKGLAAIAMEELEKISHLP